MGWDKVSRSKHSPFACHTRRKILLKPLDYDEKVMSWY